MAKHPEIRRCLGALRPARADSPTPRKCQRCGRLEYGDREVCPVKVYPEIGFRYRGFEITYTPSREDNGKAGWYWIDENYDGAPDSLGRHWHGYEKSVPDCIAEIDEIHEDNPWLEEDE